MQRVTTKATSPPPFLDSEFWKEKFLEIKDRFMQLDDPIKFGIVAGAAIVALAFLYCLYRICCVKRTTMVLEPVVVTADGRRRVMTVSQSRSGSRQSRSSESRTRDAYREPPRRSARNYDERPRDRDDGRGGRRDERRPSRDDRRIGQDLRGLGLDETMQGTEGTMQTTDDAPADGGGAGAPMAYPPPTGGDQGRPAATPVNPAKRVSRVAKRLKRLLRKSGEDAQLPQADTTSNILNMLGSVPAQPTQEVPTFESTAGGGGVSAPGYEELGPGVNLALPPPPRR